MKAPPFDYVVAGSLPEAIATLAADEDAKILAGGQSLIPLLSLRLARPTVLVDIGRLALDTVALDTVALDVDDTAEPGGQARHGELRLGALICQRRLEFDPVVASAAPLLAEAVGQVGFPAIRNRGTLGGSLAHADPAAELPAVMVALGATVVVEGPAGRRAFPASELAAGFFSTTLDAADVLVEIHIRAAGPAHGAAWCEWSSRAHDFAEAGVGVAVELDERGDCTWVGAAACGVATVPLDLGEVLAAAGVGGARNHSPGLLASVAAATEAACHGLFAAGESDRGSPEGDRPELAGLLVARAVRVAFDRAQQGDR
jgi:carbon-monoxide dehydrogenase medium subunit